jgi:uncharacterized membrane protein
MDRRFKHGQLFVIGVALLVLGVTLILAWWDDLIILFRGGMGFVLALIGLFVLYNIKD